MKKKPPFTLGYSSCPNDTFIFKAIAEKLIDTHGYHLNIVLEDVELKIIPMPFENVMPSVMNKEADFGEAAIMAFFEKAWQSGLINPSDKPLFAC